MPAFKEGTAPDRYACYETDTFKCVGRYEGYLPVSNRMVPSEYVQREYGKLGDEGLDPSGYGVPQLTHESTVRNLAKYNGPAVSPDKVDPAARAFAKESLKKVYRAMTPKIRRIGVDELIDGNLIELKKSPGFPWNRSGYQTHADVLASHREWVTQHVQDVLDGARPSVVWNAFPKEELRTAEKIAAGKVRHISGCPTEFKILCGVMLLAFSEAFYEMHGIGWSEVGMTLFNGGWHRLAQKLRRHKKMLAADLAQQDADFQNFMAQDVGEVIYDLHPIALRTEQTRSVLIYILDQTQRGYQVNGEGFVWAKEHGNSSGNSITVILNGLATEYGVNYSYYRAYQAFANKVARPICNTPHRSRAVRDAIELALDEVGLVGPSTEELYSNVIAAIYGDDNTGGVSERLLIIVNHDTLEQGYKELGWKVTFDTKEWMTLEEVSFLSHRFHKLPNGVYVPVPVDGKKLVASLEQKSRKTETYLQLYERARGLYISAFWDTPARNTIGHVMESLIPHLTTTPQGRAALLTHQTDSQIRTLYLGF